MKIVRQEKGEHIFGDRPFVYVSLTGKRIWIRDNDSTSWEPEIQDGTWRRYSLPKRLLAESANGLMETVAGISGAARAEGWNEYQERWQNVHVEIGMDADIEREIRKTIDNPKSFYQIWSPEEYFQNDPPVVEEGADIEAMAEELTREAHADMGLVVVFEGLEEYLESLRAE